MQLVIVRTVFELEAQEGLGGRRRSAYFEDDRGSIVHYVQIESDDAGRCESTFYTECLGERPVCHDARHIEHTQERLVVDRVVCQLQAVGSVCDIVERTDDARDECLEGNYRERW